MADYDLFVIGAGSGGVACARRAATYGAKVAIAEASRVGGTCVIRGCVPKKIFRFAAAFAEAFKAAPAYGWSEASPRIDFEAFCRTRNREIERLNGIYIAMLERAGVRLFMGRATILPERTADGGFTVAIGEDRVTARRVLVAVGGRPSLPEVPGIEHAMTSDEVTEQVYPLPRRLAIVGAGYIGVEFASMFTALGVETTMVLRGDLPLRGFEEDLRTHLTGQLEAGGVRLWTGTTVEEIRQEGQGLVVATSRGPLEVDRLIYATGRAPIPNTKGLGLEALGVRMKRNGGIYVDVQYQSNVEGIFALGDCSDHGGHGMDSEQHDLTPIAIAEGRALAETWFNDNPTLVAYDSVPTAIFSLPEASTVGLTEARARLLGHEVTIYRTTFRPMFHTITGFEQRTLMKLVVDKATDRVLGCHMVGEDAAEIIQGFAVALTAGATKAQFDATVALHPTAAEEFVTMYQPVAS